MRLSLKALARRALREYSSSRRPGWVLAQPAQLAVLVSSIHWCQVCTGALYRCTGLRGGSLLAARPDGRRLSAVLRAIRERFPPLF